VAVLEPPESTSVNAYGRSATRRRSWPAVSVPGSAT